MEHMKYWSVTTNPETGMRFENALGSLEDGSNGKADIQKLLDSPFGAELTSRYLDRIRFEQDVMSEECLSYFRERNLKKELHDDEDYYIRWFSYSPLDMYKEEGSRKKYPLIICNLMAEAAAFDNGFGKIAGKEKFMFVIPENTNWDFVSALIEKVCDMYPVDRERIYLTGFSYGGYQAMGTYFRLPWKFAAVAQCGNDVYRDWDNWRIPYTEGELATLKHVVVPVMQFVGECEASNFVPLNDWHPRGHESSPKRGTPAPRDPRADRRKDPTICPQRKLPDGSVIPTPISMMPHPAEGEDPGLWNLGRLNKRLSILGCKPRDIDTCLSYAAIEGEHLSDTEEIHRVLGFYGDEEYTAYLYGHRHYVADIYNEDGLNVFHYVVWENGVHAFPITMGEMVWDYVKQFRRDSATGKIVRDMYCPE